MGCEMRIMMKMRIMNNAVGESLDSAKGSHVESGDAVENVARDWGRCIAVRERLFGADDSTERDDAAGADVGVYRRGKLAGDAAGAGGGDWAGHAAGD